MSSSSDSDEEIILYYMWKNKYYRKRKIWVRELFLNRTQNGEFWKLHKILVRDSMKFQNYYRMTEYCFNKLCKYLKPLFHVGHTNYRKTIEFEERLTVTLRYLATGESFSSASYRFGISHNEISIIVSEMLDIIYEALNKEFLKFPNKEDFTMIAEGFAKKNKFPNCIGALDGKHVRIRKPAHGGSLFYNYKSYHSIVLLALVDSDYKFCVIDVGAYGRSSDGGVFENSKFGKLLSNKELQLPNDCPIVEGGEPLPFVIVADEAFRLTENIMKPFPRRQLDDSKRIFNQRLSAACQMVECTFGILVAKFRVFETAIAVAPEKVDKIIKRSCVLHNFIRTIDCESSDIERASLDNRRCFESLQYTSVLSNVNQSTMRARHIRNCFMHYFTNNTGGT